MLLCDVNNTIVNNGVSNYNNQQQYNQLNNNFFSSTID